ncbi:MAG: hypothetical protein AAF546_07320 [Verrucomicrobiota bacterium]
MDDLKGAGRLFPGATLFGLAGRLRVGLVCLFLRRLEPEPIIDDFQNNAALALTVYSKY